MVSKKNIQERLRKVEEKKERHSIRKFTVGTASVLIGLTFMGMASSKVAASEFNQENVVVENTVSTNNSETAKDTNEAVVESVDSQVNESVSTTSTKNVDVATIENENSDVTNVATEEKTPEVTTSASESSVIDENNKDISQEEVSASDQVNNIDQVQLEKAEIVKKPSYEDSKAEVDKINGEINKDLEDVVNEANKIDGVTVDKKDPNKVTTGTTDIDKNKAEIIANNKKQIEEILKALEEHQAALKDYEGRLDEYNKKRDEYIQKLKDLGLWDENTHIDPDKLSQLLILGKEENATVTVKPLHPNVVQVSDNSNMLNGLLNNFWQVNGTVNGDFLQVTYTDLENSYYAGNLISKIEITYSDFIISDNPYQGNKTPGIYFGKSPTDGFFYAKAESVTMDLKMYDANGKLITLGDNTAYITIGSLNSKGEGNDYVEKAEIINGSSHKGEGIALPESSVTIHKGPNGDILYSDKNNELIHNKKITAADRELAIKIWGKDVVDKYLGWDDSSDRSKEIFGAGLFKVSGDGIKIKFSNKLGSAWATFSTTIPKITFDAEKPEKPTTTITWQPGQLVLNKNSSAHIHYVDVNGAVLNGVTNFTPEHGFELFDQMQSHEHLAIGDKYDNILWDWEKAGYILATETVHPGATNGVITDDVQHIYVYLKHKTETTERYKEVNQTIHYVYEDGTKAADDHVSIKLVFTQTGIKNMVTGEIDWNGEWSKTQEFVTVVSPTIDGYTADKPEVGPYQITVDNSNFDQNLDKIDIVTYTKNPEQPTQPSEPTSPTTPEDKPNVPEDQPTNPTSPTTPEDKPSIPEEKPTDPIQPSAPIETPDEEISAPVLPEETPSAPEEQPAEKEENTVAPKPEKVIDSKEESSTTKVETATPKSEKTEFTKLVVSDEKKADNVKRAPETVAQALPKTGTGETNKASVFGLAIAAIASMFGIAGVKKRKKN